MAHKTSKDQGLRLDGAAGTLVDISGDVNSQSLTQALTILDDTGMGDTAHTSCLGLASGSIPLNGWVNSTTDDIFGPVAQGTSVTKTIEYKVFTGRYYNGEINVENYELSGSPDTLQAWSANMVFTGAVSRTSKVLA